MVTNPEIRNNKILVKIQGQARNGWIADMSFPFIVVFMGVCGSGKTTVASEFARRLSYSFIEGDDFHPEENRLKMQHGVPLTDEDRFPWLTALSLRISFGLAQAERLSVSCSALKKSYRVIHHTYYHVDDLTTYAYLTGHTETRPRRPGHVHPP
jgi:gluconokinase